MTALEIAEKIRLREISPTDAVMSVAKAYERFEGEYNCFASFNVEFALAQAADVEKKLKLSDKTVTKAFKLLAEHKLIYEKRLGFRKKNIIYVGKINHVPTAEIMNRKNYDSRNGETTIQESENLRCSNNKYNKNNYSNTPQRKNSYTNYEQRVYEPEQLEKLYCNV